MTDEHGPDSDPLHEDASHEEHAPVPAESTGTWSDDHPPVDDFSDVATASEEAATTSEEVSEETSGEEAPPPASPSRSMLPLFAGIGGILLVGAMIYWQFGHSSPPTMIAQTQAPKSAAVLPPSPSPSPKPVVAPLSSGKVEESDITALYKAPPEPAPLPIPSPSPAKPPIMSSTVPPAAPPVPAMAPSQVNPSVPLAPPASAIMSAPPAPADARIDKLAASVNDLQKSVEATTQEVNKLTTMVAATQAMPPVPGQVSSALEDRLNKIEQGLKQIEHNGTAKPAPAVATPPETEATSEVITKPVAHHKKPVKHKQPVHKKTVHQPASLTAKAPIETPSAWVLRAATPGEAWVAADAHTSELKHVQVGDSLAGIGTIRAIRQTPGGWEIEGATGTIR